MQHKPERKCQLSDIENKPVDFVNNPPHYRIHPSGIEVIDLIYKQKYSIGNAVKYLMRHKNKNNPQQDLEKALWYLKRADRDKDSFFVDVDVAFIWGKWFQSDMENGYPLSENVHRALYRVYSNRILSSTIWVEDELDILSGIESPKGLDK